MSGFVQTLAATAAVGLSRSLRSLESFAVSEIAPGYSIAQWRNDPEVNRDLRQLFRQYSAKSPLLDGALETLVDRARSCEGRFEGIESKGLLVAYLLDSLAISLPSDRVWRTTKLELSLTEIGEHGDVQERSELVLHASSPEHVLEHAKEFESRRRYLVEVGQHMVDQRERLLPNLRFCGDVEATLADLGRNDPRLPWVRRCLFELNDHCNNWLQGEFRHEQLPSRPSKESPSVEQNDEFRRLRVFTCPDGQQRYFEWHLKNIAMNLRIHYFPKADERIVLVGYIGRHLPTRLYR